MTTPSRKDNLPVGIAAAVVGALVGAFAWAVLVSVTDYKIGFAAIGVGALAGFLAGRFGGAHPALPFVVAVIALLGCVLGDLFIDAHQVSKAAKEFADTTVSDFTVFKEMVKDPTGFGWEVYKEGFEALDALFYVLAAVFGYRLAQQIGAQTTAPKLEPGNLPFDRHYGLPPEGGPAVSDPAPDAAPDAASDPARDGDPPRP